MKIIVRALGIFIILTLLCGFIYPSLTTGIAQVAFPKQANGSIIEVEGVKYGSALMGQNFTGQNHMWGRIMNLDVSTYKDEEGNPVVYAGPSNKSPAGEEFEELVSQRVEKIKAAHPEMGDTPIPVDLVTCSGSGLDPQISLAAAQYQAKRLAKANGISEEEVNEIIRRCTEKEFLGIFGESTVNVLKVNLMLEGILK